jgi:FkbM family methyltransferase
MFKSHDELVNAIKDFKFDNMFSDQNLKGIKLCLFGFTNFTRFIIDKIGPEKVYCISDNDYTKWGGVMEYKGVKILSPSDIMEIPEIRVFITKKKFAKIYAFEVSASNFKQLQDYVGSLDENTRSRISLYDCGLGEMPAVMNYTDVMNGTAIDGTGELSANIERMDDVLRGERVTFIKMDIEGGEMAALRGCANIITQQRPKLAICCYHQFRGLDWTGSSDLFDIPAYIKSLVPEYKILIRHHGVSNNLYETVCYAIP